MSEDYKTIHDQELVNECEPWRKCEKLSENENELRKRCNESEEGTPLSSFTVNPIVFMLSLGVFGLVSGVIVHQLFFA